MSLFLFEVVDTFNLILKEEDLFIMKQNIYAAWTMAVKKRRYR